MRWVMGLVVVTALVGGSYAGWRGLAPKHDQPPVAPDVPVTVAVAKEQEIPVYLRGIGSVRALNAVELHPQVGGVLLQVPVGEGDAVRKGDVLAVIDPRPFKAALDKAEAQVTQDQAQLENAQLDQRRYASLAQRDFASRQQVDTQAATVARLEGVAAADRASVEEAQINLGYTVLHAPMDGRVGLRRVDPGNVVQANATGAGILTVVQEQPISVVFTLPERELADVKAAMARGPVKVLADTADHGRQLAEGVLLTPDNVVDPASGTFSLKATFANRDGALTPGQFVSTRLQSATAHGMTVPREAVQHGQDGLFVLLAKDDKTADRRKVKVAYDDGKTAVVTDGLRAGERVIVSGQSRVGKGTRLAWRDDAPAPAE